MYANLTTSRVRRLSQLFVAAGVAMASVPLLAGTSSADDFSNTAAIVIPGPPPPMGCPNFQAPENSCPPTTATPYPSPIAVAGITGAITDVNVTLKGFTHESPADLDVMLQAPGGRAVMLMSDACAGDNNQNPIASAIDLTFDDAASGALPADTACGAGSFKPVDDDDDPNFQFTGNDAFPAPAPASATSVQLSSLNGIDPNGTWNLWVVDDFPGTQGVNSGQFAGGWVLSVATPNTAANTTTTVATTASTTTTTVVTSTTTTMASGSAATTTTTRAANVAGRSAQPVPATLPRTGPDADNLALARLAGLLIAGGLLLSLLTQPKTTPAGRRRPKR